MTSKTRFTAVLAASLLAAGAALAGAGLELGAAMPAGSNTLVASDGTETTLEDLRGEKGTLVVFTCNTCPWAKAWEERIVALGNEYATRGIGVVAINPNDPGRVPGDSLDAMKTRASELGMSFPYAHDAGSAVARVFGAKVTPEAYLFDAGGALVYHGTIDDNAKSPDAVSKRYLADALEAVATGGAVPVADTKALGCGIKFAQK